ncbi:hypothetical protein ACHAXN_008318 [Cyclotella atomus]
MTPKDYSKFGAFFDKVIRDYHGDESGDKKHITDWKVDDADYDVKKLGQDELSMRTWEPIQTSLPMRSIKNLLMPMSCSRTWMLILTSRALGFQVIGLTDVDAGSPMTR